MLRANGAKVQFADANGAQFRRREGAGEARGRGRIFGCANHRKSRIVGSDRSKNRNGPAGAGLGG